jgi:hypothetical protein
VDLSILLLKGEDGKLMPSKSLELIHERPWPFINGSVPTLFFFSVHKKYFQHCIDMTFFACHFGTDMTF